MDKHLLIICLIYVVSSVVATDESNFNANNMRSESDTAATTKTTGQTSTDETDDFAVISPLLPTPEMCRVQRFKGIVGGEKTRLDEYPWLALLEYSKRDNTTAFHCGGALINDRYILTAAHCVLSSEIVKGTYKLKSVRLGEYQISSDRDCVEDNCADPPINLTIEKKIVHELYRPASVQQEHDIALLRLSQSVKYTNYIKPICLPGSTRLKSKTFDDEYMNVAGWGMTENGTNSDFKLKVRIPVVPWAECVTTYKSRTTIGSNQLCAGGAIGKDSCGGDSGGPLLFTDQSHPTYSYLYCVGVVSFGPRKCGQNGMPGIYTRVTSYIDWIVKNVRE